MLKQTHIVYLSQRLRLLRFQSFQCLCGYYLFFIFLIINAATCSADTFNLSPVYWDAVKQRWRDSLGNPYDNAQIAVYDYADASVSCNIRGTVFSITGTDLKPNFTYQLKLNGKPVYFWGIDGDDEANEQIGFAGRWWVKKIRISDSAEVDGWNGTDTEYNTWKAAGFTDGTYDYIFEGYLLIGYFVTDENGSAAEDINLDSSFHVLWRVDQRIPAVNDSIPSDHTIVIEGDSAWYPSSLPNDSFQLYAEWEPDRALPGELSFPEGTYNLRLFLTEESFHENQSNPSSGDWATVMAHDDIQFEIKEKGGGRGNLPFGCSAGKGNRGFCMLSMLIVISVFFLLSRACRAA